MCSTNCLMVFSHWEVAIEIQWHKSALETYICMHPLAYFCKLIFLSLVQSVSVKTIESCVYVKDKNKAWERPKDKMEFGKDTALFDQVSPHDSSFMGADPNPPPPPNC
jgi:hypothetical protein